MTSFLITLPDKTNFYFKNKANKEKKNNREKTKNKNKQKIFIFICFWVATPLGGANIDWPFRKCHFSFFLYFKIWRERPKLALICSPLLYIFNIWVVALILGKRIGGWVKGEYIVQVNDECINKYISHWKTPQKIKKIEKNKKLNCLF